VEKRTRDPSTTQEKVRLLLQGQKTLNDYLQRQKARAAHSSKQRDITNAWASAISKDKNLLFAEAKYQSPFPHVIQIKQGFVGRCKMAN